MLHHQRGRSTSSGMDWWPAAQRRPPPLQCGAVLALLVFSFHYTGSTVRFSWEELVCTLSAFRGLSNALSSNYHRSTVHAQEQCKNEAAAALVVPTTLRAVDASATTSHGNRVPIGASGLSTHLLHLLFLPSSNAIDNPSIAGVRQMT